MALKFKKRKLFTPLVILFMFITILYMIMPVYDFEPGQPFGGEKIKNPYDSVDFSSMKRANFHAHTNRSDGRNSVEEVVSAYQELGYDIIAISDHSRFTRNGLGNEQELGIYEKGLNPHRFHALSFGSENTIWFDIPLWQTLSHRYRLLEHLFDRSELVVLNHPNTIRGLSEKEMKHLSFYHYIEADDNLKSQTPYWDVALSNGHPCYTMANDDLHNLGNPQAIARKCTFLATSGNSRQEVMEALEKGHGYAMTLPEKKLQPKVLPKVLGVSFINDTLGVLFSEPAKIRFIGQGGVAMQETIDSTANYLFKSKDTYIRVEAEFESGIRIYLNPLIRYSGYAPTMQAGGKINIFLTGLNFIFFFLLFLAQRKLLGYLWKKSPAPQAVPEAVVTKKKRIRWRGRRIRKGPTA